MAPVLAGFSIEDKTTCDSPCTGFSPGFTPNTKKGIWKSVKKFWLLGYYIGIGGSIWWQEERAKDWSGGQFCHILLDRILIETNAPVILPHCKDTIPSKLLCCSRNTSMILQEVLKKIAELKDILAETVEVIITPNVIQLFDLAIEA